MSRQQRRQNFYTSGDPAGARALTDIVLRDPDVRVQRTGLFELSRIPDPVVLPAMLIGLTSSDRACRLHAILALRRLRAREAVPTLIPLLMDRRSRVDVARTLVAIRDERALEPLKAALARSPWWQRHRLRRCVSALAGLLGY
jgi:HEAT repeat protein